MNQSYDAIVLGLGGMGSATLAELVHRGYRVLGLEQFEPVHARGSSHGHTRVIREAYYEDPAYVPLVRRAYDKWYDLEARTGRSLLVECGCLNVGPPDGELIQGVRASAAEHGLAIETLPGKEIQKRFPAMRFDGDMVGLLEQRAGYLFVEECVRAHLDVARSDGAVARFEEPVLQWQADSHGVKVQTTRATYQAERLIVTAGAWSGRILAELGIPLTVMRQILLWFPPQDPGPFRRHRLPVYLVETAEGAFYGLPAIDPRGHKAARHYGQPELPGPEGVDWNVTDADEAPVRGFLRHHLPGADAPRSDGQVCMYTLSPDRHFIIDRHPEQERVVFAAGFSGHGFKFASAVGEVLADLALKGTPTLELFRVGRFK